jgi:hypothetical protein
MRQMTKILLSACTVCAVGAAARAGAQPAPIPPPPPQTPAPVTPPPIPSDTPAPAVPNPPDSPTDTPPAIPNSNDPSAPATDPNAVPPAPTPVTTVDINTSTSPSYDLDDNPYSYAWYEPMMPSGIGVSTIAGGGVAGFTDRTMRSTTSDVGGAWGLKVAIGSHLPLALELGYTGSATNINGLPTGAKGTLIGSTAEGAVRWNVLPHLPVTPYLFAGVGWQRYDVTETTVSLSDSGMNDHDNLLVFPVGTGVAYRVGGFVADLRGTFRAATDEDLVLTGTRFPTANNNFAAMHTWEASAALGYEF